jgi:hypothetical protein
MQIGNILVFGAYGFIYVTPAPSATQALSAIRYFGPAIFGN